MKYLLSNLLLKIKGQRELVLNVSYLHGAIKERDKLWILRCDMAQRQMEKH